MNKQKFINKFISVAIMTVAANTAISGTATAPDAGQILNEIERNEKFLFPDADGLQNIKPNVEPEAKDEPRVELKSFSFSGNQELSAEKINDFLNNFINQSVTVNELQSIASRLADFYRYNGYIALVTLPDQDITQGNLELRIQEAKYGGTDITTENGASKVKESILKNLMGFNMKDKTLSLKEVDRRILIINDLPGVTAKSTLAAGDNEGETKVNLVVNNTRPFAGSGVVLDNYGSRATGRARAVANLNINSPFGLGDQIRLTALKTEGVDYGRFDYSLPVGASGLTIGGSLSYLEYDVIPSEFDSVDPNGYSTIVGLNANYPLIRSQELNLNLFSELDNKSFKNKNNTGTLSDYDVQTFTLGRVEI
jgi:hemolysin activation/secretion protein